MSKDKKSQSQASKKAFPPKKTKASKRGNFPPKKDCVTIHIKGQGFKSVDIKTLIGKGEREPVKRDDETLDQFRDRVADYRARYRKVMKQVNNAPTPKPRTIFDLWVANGATLKHPSRAVAVIMEFLRDDFSGIHFPHGELRILLRGNEHSYNPPKLKA